MVIKGSSNQGQRNQAIGLFCFLLYLILKSKLKPNQHLDTLGWQQDTVRSSWIAQQSSSLC